MTVYVKIKSPKFGYMNAVWFRVQTTPIRWYHFGHNMCADMPKEKTVEGVKATIAERIRLDLRHGTVLQKPDKELDKLFKSMKGQQFTLEIEA